MYVLSEKLRTLKRNLKARNSNLFGNVHTKVKEAESHLDVVQSDIQMGGYIEALRNQEKACMINLKDALHKEHLFWKEMAKVS